MVDIAELTPENDQGYGSANILILGMDFHPADFGYFSWFAMLFAAGMARGQFSLRSAPGG